MKATISATVVLAIVAALAVQSVGAGNPGTGRAVPIAGAGIRIGVSAGDVARRDDLSGTHELLVIHVDTVIDYGDGGAIALAQ